MNLRADWLSAECMKNDQDRREAGTGSLLDHASAREETGSAYRPRPDADRGSLLSFPGAAAGLDESPAERHARARREREEKLEARRAAVEPTARIPEISASAPLEEPAKPVPSDREQSLFERLMRRGKPEQTEQPPVADTSPPADDAGLREINEAIDRLDARLRDREAADASRRVEHVSATATDATPAERISQVRADAADDGWKPLIDPMRVVNGVLDAKGIIVALTVLGGCIGIAVALSTPKKFEATAEILIDPRDLKIGDRPLTDVNGLPSDSTIALVENQVRVLTSGTVLNRVADELRLEDDPEFNGQGSGLDLNPLNLVRSLLTRSDGAADPGYRRATTINNLAESVSVERTGRTFVVLVNAKTNEAEKSALIANKMIDAFLDVSGRMQANSAGRANAEVVAQLDRLRSELEAAEQKVEKFRAENDLVGVQGRLITDDELIKLNDQLAVARARSLELNARAETARAMNADTVVGGAIPEAAASPVISELRSQYAAAKQEADRMAVRLGPRHPSYQAAQAQLSAVQTQISAELRRVSAQVQTELKRSVQTEQELAARLAQLKVRQGDVSGDLVALRDLDRDAQAKRSVYEAYLLRANETSEQKEINSANISVISQASPPIRSTGTSRAVIAGTGAFLGFLAGVALGAVRGIAGSLGETIGQSRGRTPAPARERDNPSRRDPQPQPGGAVRRRDDETPSTEDNPMNPPYPPHGYAPYPAQPQPQPQAAQPHYAPQPAWPYPQVQQPPYPQQVQQPPYPQQVHAAPPVMPYPQPWPYAPQAAPAWPPAPQPVYAQPVMPAPPVYSPYAQPAPQAPVAQPAQDQSAIASITETVREFRDAVRELADTRMRRRYF